MQVIVIGVLIRQEIVHKFMIMVRQGLIELNQLIRV